MRRFKNIALICDEESLHDAVIGRAIWLAKANGARITMIDVIEAAPGDLFGISSVVPGIRPEEVERDVLAFHRKRLERIAAPIKSEGLETEVVVLQGNPFVEIIRWVIRNEHDLLIKGTAGGTEERSLFFASTDLHLLRKCPCPVWVMKRTGRRQYARVLAAVDPDSGDRQRQALNSLIMDLATSLSKMDGSELHIVNAWKLNEEHTLRNSSFARLAAAEVDLLLDAKRRESGKKLDELLQGYPDRSGDWEVHQLKGDPRDIIPRVAAKKRVELIVMGTVARSGIRGLIIGNTAESILQQVHCSVLAVKPPEFESPVR